MSALKPEPTRPMLRAVSLLCLFITCTNLAAAERPSGVSSDKVVSALIDKLQDIAEGDLGYRELGRSNAIEVRARHVG